ncbi:MAG TPA: hypothetical protein VLG50_06535 [Candidatus Saccharimonadales bacterium]|nr:hypothetical protein [Candidatus Saccharimonadales bacterium]
MILPDDVIYQILYYADIKSILSFCLTSKKQWCDKLFWMTMFSSFPLKYKWQKVVDKKHVYDLIRYYQYFLQLKIYHDIIKSVKFYKYQKLTITCHLQHHHKFKINTLFNILNNDHDLTNVNVIYFIYNGYIWITSSTDDKWVVNAVHSPEIEHDMDQFLYKMIKYQLPIFIDW